MTDDLQSLLTQLESTGTHFCGWPAVQDQESCHAAGLLMQRAALAISQLQDELQQRPAKKRKPVKVKLEKVPKERKPSPLIGTKVPVKYRAGVATWTGRGKKPKWVVDALAGGYSLESFRV
jgi:DNA-binding protein H-NS